MLNSAGSVRGRALRVTDFECLKYKVVVECAYLSGRRTVSLRGLVELLPLLS